MRAPWLGTLLLITGCATVAPTVTTLTAPADRVAMSTMPAPPLAMAGAPGMSLTGRLMAGTPQSLGRGDGVGFSLVQPELGGLLQINERTYVGGHFVVASGAFGSARAPGVVAPSTELLGLDLGVSAGHDLPLGERVGLTLAGEFGVRHADLLSTSRLGTTTTPLSTALGTLGVGVYTTVGKLRFYAGGVATTAVWNTSKSTITRTCVDGSCSTTDSGTTTTTFVGMAGTGVRWQVDRGLAISSEVWVPVVAQAVRPAPMLSVTVHVGPFSVGRKSEAPPVPPEEPLAEPPMIITPL